MVTAVAVLSLPAGALASTQTPRIVGGSGATITQFPWQVYLEESNPGGACGGSILDATHVLTAAHCIVPEGTTAPRPAADVKVLAGVSNVAFTWQGKPLPAGAQLVAVSSLRVHPYYHLSPSPTDDVAVLTLATRLAFNSSVRPISLATALPPAGTPVTISGYGQEQDSPAPGNPNFMNGTLNWTTQRLLSADDPGCQPDPHGPVFLNSAVMFCADSPSSSPCFGDSGGALVAGNPAAQIGVLSALTPSAAPCGPTASGYANVTAPEVRDFIEGSSAPPVAPRPTAMPQIWGADTSVDYSPVTCTPGTWSGSPSVAYSFETTGGTVADPLQAGSASVFTPTAALIGQQISCTVIATNAGGTSVLRTGALAPIAADTIPPWSRVVAHKCAHRSCSLTVTTGDSNSYGLVGLQAALIHRQTVVAHCVRRGHHRRVRCIKHEVRTLAAAVTSTAPDTYQVTVSHIPYGSSRLTITAIDAAGNHQSPATVVRVFQRRPTKHRRHHRRHR